MVLSFLKISQVNSSRLIILISKFINEISSNVYVFPLTSAIAKSIVLSISNVTTPVFPISSIRLIVYSPSADKT